MRITSRLLALFLLIVAAAFTNLVAPVSHASVYCEDGSYAGYVWARQRPTKAKRH